MSPPPRRHICIIRSIFYLHKSPCGSPALVACVCLTSCVCSLLSIGAISLNRYIYICHQHLYNKIYSFRNTLVMCIGLWVFSFVVELANFLGWGDHSFDSKAFLCNWDRLASFSYSIFFPAVGVLFPIILISICYGLIYRYIQRSKPNLRLLFEIGVGGKSDPMKEDKVRKQIRQQTQMFFACFLVFTLCWTPYAFLVALDFLDNAPLPVHLYLGLLAHINSSLNFIIYGVLNNNFRNAYLHLLGFAQSSPGEDVTLNKIENLESNEELLNEGENTMT